MIPKRYPTLLISTLLLYLSTAVITQFDSLQIINIVLMTIVALSGVYVASENRLATRVSAILATLWIILLWIHSQGEWAWSSVAASMSGAFFIGYTIYLMLGHIFRAKQVKGELLAGAAAVYLLLGLVWSFMYDALNHLFVDSFSETNLSFLELLYFSLTTLTTLGYGDILPGNPLTRMLAVLEAAVGVLYSAILIGRLLGIHLAGRGSQKSDE
jgi:hypothetical protein